MQGESRSDPAKDEAAEDKRSSTRILEQLEEEEDQEHQAKMLQEAMTAVPDMDEDRGDIESSKSRDAIFTQLLFFRLRRRRAEPPGDDPVQPTQAGQAGPSRPRPLHLPQALLQEGAEAAGRCPARCRLGRRLPPAAVEAGRWPGGG